MSRRPISTRRFPKYTVGLLAILLATGFLVARGFSSSSELGNPSSNIMLAWTTGGVDPTFAASTSQVPGVEGVAEVRNGIGWLTSWGDTDAPSSTPPSGFFVPVEVAAIDPSDYASFVPPDERPLFEQLASGGALLGRTGAALRGITGAGTLQFREATIPVIGVVDDELVGSHEVVVSHKTGAELGIDDLRYLLIDLDRGTSHEEVAEILRTKIPRDSKLGTRTPDGEAAFFRPGGTTLPQARIKQKFGEFAARPTSGVGITIDPNWIEANTANVTFPLLGLTRCHKELLPLVRQVLDEAARQGLPGLIREDDFGGCFAPRQIGSDPNSGISHHAWGVALDVNVSRNRFGEEPRMDRRLVEIFERYGFAWGGEWLTPDGMHFEYLREPQG